MTMSSASKPMPSDSRLITELQTHGVRLHGPDQEHVSRRGGAGPSDHQAITIDGHTVMVPIYTQSAWHSPFSLDTENGRARLLRDKIPLTDITYTSEPNFYRLTTDDGIPYSHIATLHSRDVLATTVLQTCIRYQSRRKTCKFCSIGQSLAAGRTIERKTPQQLAEVAKAAVELDGVQHMVMTTGTPPTPDRGASIMCESVAAIKAAVDLPVQGQCEPPDDAMWFQRMRDAGIDSLGMHLEAVTEPVRQHVMPGKAGLSVDVYMEAFAQAVEVFGRAQVSTYILAGLGDSAADVLRVSKQLVDIGVYPFVVPFVPIRGTPMEDHPAPDADFMESILQPLGMYLQQADMHSHDIKAGCGRCGACSSLSKYEQNKHESVTPL